MKWKDIEGYEGLYQISENGDVKRLPRMLDREDGRNYVLPEKIMAHKINKFGYHRIGLTIDKKQKFYQIHRLVAQAFIPNPENKPHINHKDCDKNNNHASNLEWCTPKENVTHSWANDRPSRMKGSKNGMAKLTERQVRAIKQRLANGETLIAIGNRYKVSFHTISLIKLGKTWSHIK